MDKLITVIIPAEYNEKYINKALRSLSEQSYSNIEALVLHSNVVQLQSIIEKKYTEDIRFKYIQTSSNLNVGAVRNIGIANARGEFVYFLDSDDYLTKDTLRILYNNIQDSPVITGKMEFVSYNSHKLILPGSHIPKIYGQNRFLLLKNNSSLNFLISKSYIDRINLKFNEEVKTFSDLSFMVILFESVKNVPVVEAAIYYRRQRNDPINHPSLRQLDIEQLTNDFFIIYKELKSKPLSRSAEQFLDYKLLNFYRKELIPLFRNETKIDTHFDKLSNLIKKVNNLTLKKQDSRLMREVKAMNKGIKTYKYVNKLHNFFRTIFRETGPKHGVKGIVYRLFFTKLSSKKNDIIFESFQGKSYSDSPKYIYQYMIKHNMNYKFIWVANEGVHIPGHPTTVKRFSLKYYYYIARAKYIVSNVRMPNNYIKRDDQVYLQTWHGTPLKRLAGDMEDVHMPGTNSVKYKKNFNRETNKWDYLIAPNLYSAEIFKRAFWFDNTLLKTGYPRNDILTNNNDPVIIDGFKKRLNLPSDKKIILYAPTWRDDEFYKVGKYHFSLRLDLERMQAELGDDYIILLRMHYVVASNLDLTGLEGFAYDVSKYNDVSELYLISDILITDYSSVFFDYANLRRPILFYTYDIEKYQGQLRGFYIDMEKELPGPMLRTNDEVFEAIHNIEDIEKKYHSRYDAFYNRFCNWDDGRSSEKVVKEVFKQS
jgi:CDP-glycerol glycerophosphotransferase